MFYFTGGVISKSENNVLLSACIIRSPYKNNKCVNSAVNLSVCSSCQCRYFSRSNPQLHKQYLPICGQYTAHFWDNYVLNIIKVAVDLQIMPVLYFHFFPLENISEHNLIYLQQNALILLDLLGKESYYKILAKQCTVV